MNNTVNTVNERLNEKELRFMPIGTKENMFEHLQQLSGNQMKLLMGLQEMSMQDPLERESVDKQTRYVDITDISMKSIYKKLGMTEPTGISCMKKLKQLGWVTEKTSKNSFGAERKYIVIKNSVGSNDFWTKCSLNTDLYRLVKKGCRPIVAKVYLYHCFQGGMSKDKSYKYKQSLEQIAKAIGYSKNNREQIIIANEVLEQMGVISISKAWKMKDGTPCSENIYTYNHLFRTVKQMKAECEELNEEWVPW